MEGGQHSDKKYKLLAGYICLYVQYKRLSLQIILPERLGAPFLYADIIICVFFFSCLGVHTGACGTKTLRLRPTLLFQKYHTDIFLDTFINVLSNMKAS